jgi:probable phosphoglycerate mutase
VSSGPRQPLEREPAPPPGGQARREERLRLDAAAEIVLVRHGEPDWTPGGGVAVDDAGLTARGSAQAEVVAAALAARPFDALYASPLRRAQETAARVARAAGVPMHTVSDLAEIGIQVGGLTQEEVDTYFRAATRRPLAHHWDGWPGGESFRDFHARVTTAAGGILARHGLVARGEAEFTVWTPPPRRLRIGIVAHGGTNAVLLTHLLDIRPVPWEWMRFETELAAYSVVRARAIGVDGFVWSLQNFNEVDHLTRRGLR